jgi:hypothetical protein
LCNYLIFILFDFLTWCHEVFTRTITWSQLRYFAKYLTFARRALVLFHLGPIYRVGVCGNVTDTAAKEAATNKIQPFDWTLVTDICAYLDCALYVAWQDVWINTNGNKLWDVKRTAQVWKSCWRAIWREEVIPTHPCTCHTHLMHRYMLCGEQAPPSAHCDVPVTVRHILIKRSFYDNHHTITFRASWKMLFGMITPIWVQF